MNIKDMSLGTLDPLHVYVKHDVELKRRFAAPELRVAIANAFRAKHPSLTSEKAMLAANITLQMVKGMTTLYVEAGSSS
jgi:hypothetical protein